jgi:hypothetical protein
VLRTTGDEKRGPQNEGKFHDVIENKCRKNVAFLVLHDVTENKVVTILLHYIAEKKGEIRWTRRRGN